MTRRDAAAIALVRRYMDRKPTPAELLLLWPYRADLDAFREALVIVVERAERAEVGR